MDTSPLHTILRDWVCEQELNGIKQHSEEWQKVRVCTVGGSSLATIQGINPFSTIENFVSERLGLRKFKGGIQPQWGNLFEDVIKRVVEYDHKCTILGEDLYIPGGMNNPGLSYSPDGLAVIKLPITIRTAYSLPEETIVLLEFKCPYSRIPEGKVPKYYIPQVKMGLELLEFPTIGLFVEGVFRRCTWQQLGFDPECDQLLVKTKTSNPLAIGIIGVYFNPINNLDNSLTLKYNRMMEMYREVFGEAGSISNDYLNNDLGACSSELFTLIIDCIDCSILTAYYGNITYSDNTADVNAFVKNELIEYNKFCTKECVVNMGILPWKLFRLDYNYIEKEVGYLSPWIPKINEIVDLLRECCDPINETKKFNILQSFAEKNRQEAIEKKLNNQTRITG